MNSTVRLRYAKQFEPELDVRANRYIWYGTHQLFNGLTLTFREYNAGVFAAHSYKFSPATSTFIVECDPETWSKAGFEQMSSEATLDYVGDVFAQDLNGHKLLSNNSKWINFLLVKNRKWFFENVALIGDALHTAHFSIGSGTKLAMEDAIALADSFQETRIVTDALTDFEKRRRPVIEDYQAAAFESMCWFENASQYMNLSPIELAYVLMTRSGRVSYEDLERRDPAFIREYKSASIRG